jgi:hypothetical protein
MKMINRFLVMLVVLIFVSSCEKDLVNSSDNVKNDKLIANPPCIFEQYGLSHNLKMDYIASNPTFNSLTLQEVYAYSYGYSDDFFTSMVSQDYTQYEQRRLLCFNLIEKPQTAGNMLFNEGLIDPSIIHLVDSLSSILDNAASCENGTFKTVQEFTNEIDSFEFFIQSHYNVVYDVDTKTENSYAYLLGACSIARNSYQYWMDAASNQNHPWYIRFEQITYNGGCGSAKWPDWVKKALHGVKMAAVDTWGFLTCEDAFTPDYGYDQYGNRVVTGGSYSLSTAFQYAGEQSSTVP